MPKPDILEQILAELRRIADALEGGGGTMTTQGGGNGNGPPPLPGEGE